MDAPSDVVEQDAHTSLPHPRRSQVSLDFVLTTGQTCWRDTPWAESPDLKAAAPFQWRNP